MFSCKLCPTGRKLWLYLHTVIGCYYPISKYLLDTQCLRHSRGNRYGPYDPYNLLVIRQKHEKLNSTRKYVIKGHGEKCSRILEITELTTWIIPRKKREIRAQNPKAHTQTKAELWQWLYHLPAQKFSRLSQRIKENSTLPSFTFMTSQALPLSPCQVLLRLQVPWTHKYRMLFHPH